MGAIQSVKLWLALILNKMRRAVSPRKSFENQESMTERGGTPLPKYTTEISIIAEIAKADRILKASGKRK